MSTLARVSIDAGMSPLQRPPRLAARNLHMARHADDETLLRNVHAQGFSQRTMARLLHLSPSTVAKRLKQLGLSAPADPPPRMSTTRRSPIDVQVCFRNLRSLLKCEIALFTVKPKKI